MKTTVIKFMPEFHELIKNGTKTVTRRLVGINPYQYGGPGDTVLVDGTDIVLTINNTHIERIRDITDEEAKREGIVDGGCLNCGNPEPCGCPDPTPDYRDAFAYVWGRIYGLDSWLNNDFVHVIDFEKRP